MLIRARAITPLLGLLAMLVHPVGPRDTDLFAYRFPATDQLITNEFAYWNPNSPDAARSPAWVVTSGSLFARDGAGWTGPVDRVAPDADSDPHTDSAVFRLITRQSDFGDVHVQFRLSVARVTSTYRTPPVDWDGVHIWVRYQSQYSSYAVSVARRDGVVLIKKKCPGGHTNGGTYHTVSAEESGHAIPLNQWRYVGATVVNNPDGSVRITMLINGHFVVGATDDGVGCAPIRAAGAVGIRGDNAEFSFDRFTVDSFTP